MRGVVFYHGYPSADAGGLGTHSCTLFATFLLGPIALFLLSPIRPAAAAPALPNGGVVLGSLPIIGTEDDYEFTASVGDHIELRMASSDPLYPEIELRDPNGVIVDTGTDCCVSGVEHTPRSSPRLPCRASLRFRLPRVSSEIWATTIFISPASQEPRRTAF